MQYHKPNANLESGNETVSIVSGDNGFSGSVPMFPGTYVPRYHRCSPVPMFPGTEVPRFLYFNSGN